MSSCRPRSVSLELHIYSCQMLDSLQKNSRKEKVSSVLLSPHLGSSLLDWDKLRQEALILSHAVYLRDGKAWGVEMRVRSRFQVVGCIKRERPGPGQ